MTARYWEPAGNSFSTDETAVCCRLCPRHCRISDGDSGWCRVRLNNSGSLRLPYYGYISSVAIDPIEKKPLYHFHPGSKIYSVGFVGCNFRCPFCQNWQISQNLDLRTRFRSPEALVSEVVQSGCASIAFTYSEPLVHFEYLMAVLPLAKQAGLATVLVTNGCLNQPAAQELLSLCDAVNVDLKTGSKEKYQRVLGGRLETVQDFIRLALEKGVHTELTSLIVSEFNDEEADFEASASFVATLRVPVVWHLSAYRPDYQWSAPPTDLKLLKTYAQRASQATNWVYIGNVTGEFNDTYCPTCGKLIIARNGYRCQPSGLAIDPLGTATCGGCGAALPIIV